MIWTAYSKGLWMGLLLAIQVGPISLLCVRQSLSNGFGSGLAVGLGATMADLLYAVVAALGISGLSATVGQGAPLVQAGGGVLLLWFGWQSWQSRSAPRRAAEPGRGGRVFAGTFLLTLTNPLTILFFAGIFAGMGLAERGLAEGVPTAGMPAGTAAEAAGLPTVLPGLMVAAGIVTMTFGWMLLLALLASRFAVLLTPARLSLLNGLGAAGLGLFGAAMLIRSFGSLLAG